MSIADKKYKDLIKNIAINGVWDMGGNVTPRTRYADGEVIGGFNNLVEYLNQQY